LIRSFFALEEPNEILYLGWTVFISRGKGMANEIDTIHKEMWSLYHTSRIVRTAHFIAAQGNQKLYKILGTGVIILNIMIFSPLFDLIAGAHSAVIIKFLAIVAASFAGLQTLFGFQKDAESHLSAGDAYGSINRRIKVLLAEYKDQVKPASLIHYEFKKLTEEYLQANKENKGNIPTEREFEKAKKAIKLLDKRHELESPKAI
jgi:hypothetical protein